MKEGQDQSRTLTCSSVELAFLARLLGADTLLGVADPFQGWLAGEVEEAWTTAKGALVERKWLLVEEDGGIVMDAGVAALVGACAFAEASFVLRVGAGDAAGEDVRFLHVSHGLAVERVINAQTCTLTALGDAAVLHVRMAHLLGLSDQRAAPGSGAIIPHKTLSKAQGVASSSGSEIAAALLARAGLDSDAAVSLAETLTQPRGNGSVLALSWRELSWDVTGFGVLIGSQGLWRLRLFVKEGQDWVELTPCSAEQLRTELRRMTDRVTAQVATAT